MEKRLQRNEQDKMIAGVCSGLADYFDVDVTWIRIAFVVAVMAGASGLLAYIVLWIAVPRKPYIPDYTKFNADYKVYDQANPNNPVPVEAYPLKKQGKGNGRIIAGSIFIFFGTFFLLNEFDLIPDWVEIHNLWPLILIAMGIYTLARSAKKEPWKEEWNMDTDINEPIITPEPAATSSEGGEETNTITDETPNKPL